jgi:hypothetical protein
VKTAMAEEELVAGWQIGTFLRLQSVDWRIFAHGTVIDIYLGLACF